MTPVKSLALNSAWHLFASLIAGAIAPLAFSPGFIWPIGILSLLVLFYCLRRATPWQGFWRGWLYGFGLFGCGSSWVYVSIHVYGNASPALAATLTLVFVAVLAFCFVASFGYCFARWGRREGVTAVVSFAALWVLFEWLRSWLFTGFPWLLAGYAHTDTLLAHWAPLGGVYLLGFFVAISAGLLGLVVEAVIARSTGRAVRGMAILVAPWIVAALLGQFTWTKKYGDPITVRLFQPNITQDIKWLPEQRSKTLAGLQRNLLQTPPGTLLVWPENAIPAFFHQARGYTDSLAVQARERNIGIITGIPYSRTDENGDRVFHNSVVGLGSADGVYHKQKLVPFGEYVPLQSWLRGLIDFFDLPMSDFRGGPNRQGPLRFTAGGRQLNVAPYICYEVVYPDFARKLGRDSDLMLTISDDSWFGESIGPFQHLQMARLRAIENGRYLVRGTNTGVTAIISPDGTIEGVVQQFERTSLQGRVWQMRGITPYGYLGSWPILVVCVALLVWSGRRAGSEETNPIGPEKPRI